MPTEIVDINDAHPPDGIFRIAKMIPCDKGDSIEQKRYKNCNKIKVLHWEKWHLFVRSLGGPRQYHYRLGFLVLAILNCSCGQDAF
jgi:hypothetical protein